jgi:hypothetical protein
MHSFFGNSGRERGEMKKGRKGERMEEQKKEKK